jgi:hypothetical protein
VPKLVISGSIECVIHHLHGYTYGGWSWLLMSTGSLTKTFLTNEDWKDEWSKEPHSMGFSVFPSPLPLSRYTSSVPVTYTICNGEGNTEKLFLIFKELSIIRAASL